MSDSVILQREGPLATVMLNRPAKRNALDLAGWTRLARTMTEVARDDDIRCVIVRGAGDTFGAGADISAFAEERGTRAQAVRYGDAEYDALKAVADCRHPTVAAIHGACVGGGLEIAVACDIRICGASSRFGVPVNRLGLTMSYDELELVRRRVGRAATAEILLEGRVFGADRARELGLVHRVVSDDQVDDEVRDSAQRIIGGAPLVNRWHKAFLRRLDDPRPLTDIERAQGFAAFDTADYREGLQAFLQKRTPKFHGR